MVLKKGLLIQYGYKEGTPRAEWFTRRNPWFHIVPQMELSSMFRAASSSFFRTITISYRCRYWDYQCHILRICAADRSGRM
jgi:hypothetical protein